VRDYISIIKKNDFDVNKFIFSMRV
jgi:hypothetical protein